MEPWLVSPTLFSLLFGDDKKEEPKKQESGVSGCSTNVTMNCSNGTGGYCNNSGYWSTSGYPNESKEVI